MKDNISAENLNPGNYLEIHSTGALTLQQKGCIATNTMPICLNKV